MALIQVRPAPGCDDGRPAIERWWYEAPTGQPGDLYCYLDRLSYVPGETARLHVYCAAARYDLKVERDGAERAAAPNSMSVEWDVAERARPQERHGVLGPMPDTPAGLYPHGCAWPATLEL